MPHFLKSCKFDKRKLFLKPLLSKTRAYILICKEDFPDSFTKTRVCLSFETKQ